MLIHGRRGLSSPLLAAWELARAWRDAELRVIENSGHTADGDVLEIPTVSLESGFYGVTEAGFKIARPDDKST